MMASASRRARNLPNPDAVNALSLAIEPLVWAPSRATPPISTAGGGGRPRSHAQRRATTRRRTTYGSISTATSRSRPRKTGTAPTGSEETAFTFTSTPLIIIVRVIGTPSRRTLSISTITSAPRQLPITRPRPPRIDAPPMITDAITISSALRPAWEVAPLSWAIAIRPAIVAHSDDRR